MTLNQPIENSAPRIHHRTMTDTFNFRQSLRLLRWVGYGLLVLVLFDFADVLIPPQFMNPTWELQAVGTMVEQVPLLWIGLMLIFLGESYGYSKGEKILLKTLSWFTLLAGIAYLLFIPLTAINSVRIDRENYQEVTTEVAERMPVIQQVKTELDKAETASDLARVLSYLNGAGISPEIKNGQKFQEVKAQLSKSIAQGESQLNTQAQTAIESQRLSLIKKCVKWNLGALISGFLLLSIWRGTQWVRHLQLEED